MNSKNKSINLPSFVASITGEVETGYWSPQTIEEWAEVQKTSAFISVWVQQQEQERTLRRMIGIWLFVLISLQIIGVFGLVLLDAFKLLILNADIVKFLIPSVLSEVFGMGYVVVKYLFNPASLNRLIFGNKRER